MNEKNYTISIEKQMSFSKEDLSDILCSCIEGGCNYWAMIDNATKEFKLAMSYTNKNAVIEDVIMKIWDMDNPLIILEDDDESGNFIVPHKVYLNDFLNGIKLSIENQYWDGEDTGDVDSDVGDVIMQYACFKEVVYA